MRRASANFLLGERDTDVIAHAAGASGLRGEQYFRTEGKMLMTNANEEEEARGEGTSSVKKRSQEED